MSKLLPFSSGEPQWKDMDTPTLAGLAQIYKQFESMWADKYIAEQERLMKAVIADYRAMQETQQLKEEWFVSIASLGTCRTCSRHAAELSRDGACAVCEKIQSADVTSPT